MAYISNKERDALVKKTFNSYTFRKLIIIFEVALLFSYIVLTFLSFYFTTKNNDSSWEWIKEKDGLFTSLGWGMFFVGLVVICLGIVSIVLVFTIKSPDKIRKVINKLDSSPLPGKKGKVSKLSSSQLKARRRLS